MMSKKSFFSVLGVFLILLFNFASTPLISARNAFSPEMNRQPNSSIPQLPYFVEAGKQARVNSSDRSRFATWVDYNEDGWLDLFLCNGYNQKNRLYRNSGNGTFEDVIETVGLVNFLYSQYSYWIDYNNDGYLDLFLVNSYNDLFFKNTGQDSFINISKSLNFQAA